MAPAAAQQDFYAGKQITFIVGAGVGGGYDLQARTAARHLGRHIPGNPTIVVQNMPAAGSIAATNFMFSTAPKDGTTMALIQRGMLLVQADLSGRHALRAREVRLGRQPQQRDRGHAGVERHVAQHRTAKDLFERELIVGGIVSVDPETTPRLYNSLIGTKFKIVSGYNSTAQIALAIERGEVQGIADWSWSSFKAVRPDWIRDKKVTMLMQGALQNDPELKDLPNALDFIKNPSDRQVMELHFTQKTAARPVILPPGVPAERLAMLRRAFAALGQDKEFLAEAAKSKVEFNFVSGQEVDKVVALIVATPPEIAERYAKAFAPAQ